MKLQILEFSLIWDPFLFQILICASSYFYVIKNKNGIKLQIFKDFVSAQIQSDLTSEISFKCKFWFAPAVTSRSLKEYKINLQILEDFVSAQIKSDRISETSNLIQILMCTSSYF